MRLFILELPLYLWIVLALVAVAAIALFAWACWRNIKRPNQDKTGKMLLCLVFLLSFITAHAMEGDGSYFNPLSYCEYQRLERHCIISERRVKHVLSKVFSFGIGYHRECEQRRQNDRHRNERVSRLF